MENEMTIRLIAFVIAMGILPLYFLPTILGRKKRNADTIFLINLFTGWSGVGWTVALILALRTEPVTYPEANTRNFSRSQTKDA